MKKRLVSLLLALAVCLSLLPATASAAETELPDWYFLFAIFKNVDADGKDGDGKAVHIEHFMTEDEVRVARDYAPAFEAYMNQLGVVRAHVETIEIDETVTELRESVYGSFIGAEQAAPLLKGKVDLDQYDHVTCITALGISMGYGGITGAQFENNTGESCINFKDRESCLKIWAVEVYPWAPGYPVHEFLHFMERMDKTWGREFDLHTIMTDFYERVNGEFEECYTDILLNRAKGTAGTGVDPVVWQYPPHVLRAMTELSVPSGITGIGEWAFQNSDRLTRLSIPSSVADIAYNAFGDCDKLAEVTIQPGLTSIGGWAFGKCPALTRVAIPASVTSIGECAFYSTGLTDVYYGGTAEQWKAIQIGGYNEQLTNAAIHYNSLMADVKTTDPFAPSIAWALENGVTAGTGGGKFSPGSPCTQAQILTFLWRAKGSPAPEGAAGGDAYYASAVQWTKEQGLIDGTFTAAEPCTRAMAVTYLWKLAGSPAAKSASFTDVPAAADCARAVDWAVEQGVTSGTGAGVFSPDRACTRGQIVTFLYRALAG